MGMTVIKILYCQKEKNKFKILKSYFPTQKDITSSVKTISLLYNEIKFVSKLYGEQIIGHTEPNRPSTPDCFKLEEDN